MRRIGALAALLVVVATAPGCDAFRIFRIEEQAPLRSGPVRIDRVTFSEDRLAVRLDFTGGPKFQPNDPCSVAYEGTAEIVGDELEVGVFPLQHPKPLPEGWACEAMGHARTLIIQLDEPFLGTRVCDLAGQVILLAAPDGLVQIAGLPEGWELRGEETVSDSPTGRWRRVYSPVDNPGPNDPQVDLYQAFDAPAGVTGGDVQRQVEVNGAPATLYRYQPTGELVLVWWLGSNGVALVGNLRDFTEAEFITLAESVVPPG